MLQLTKSKAKLSKESIRDFCAEWRSGYFSRLDLSTEFRACQWDFAHFMQVAKDNRWWHHSMMQLCNLPN